MRSRFFILLVFLYSSLYYNCLSDKTCSDEDRSCNSQALLTSFFSVPEGIYIYSTTTKYQGNLAAYGSLPETSGQNICAGEKLFSSLVNQFCPQVFAMISTESVSLNSFPTSYFVSSSLPVLGPTGIQLSSSWDNFTIGENSLDRPLADAGLGTDDFWTFSSVGGGLAGSNCSMGTDNTSEFGGAIGSATSKDPDWMNQGGESVVSCDTSHRVLCVCFTPAPVSESQ